MSIVSSYGLKDKKCISVNIYSTDAAVILRDFLIRVLGTGWKKENSAKQKWHSTMQTSLQQPWKKPLRKNPMDKEGWCRPKVWCMYIFDDQCWISCLPQQKILSSSGRRCKQ